MAFIDTHTHFHDPETVDDLLWPKPGDPWNRTCLPDNYRDEVGAGPVVAVETSPRKIDDVRLAHIANSDDMIVAYVSNLQALKPGFEARLELALKDLKWRGLRLRPIEAYELHSKVLCDALAAMSGKGHVELGLRHPGRLNEFQHLCRALPDVNFVLTHCGHPSLSEPPERVAFKVLEGLDNVIIKLSPPQFESFSSPDIRYRLQHHISLLRNMLSAEKLMYGSNWPVSIEANEFKDWLGQLFSTHSGEAEAVLGGTAKRAYRLEQVIEPIVSIRP
ncbi:amidohydrolase family protein [Roseibium sp. HPY-6]|uniref:amidohydrolase family protein n=1 Tax=Roseibium sp. HPY-6 TaxID=3229852 RepID=UPI00338D5D9D